MQQSLFEDDVIAYKENPKDSTKTRNPPRINYWIQQDCVIQDENTKSIAFIYANNKQIEPEI